MRRGCVAWEADRQIDGQNEDRLELSRKAVWMWGRYRLSSVEE